MNVDETAAELVATKDALNAAYRERAHQIMKKLAGLGYLEPVRPRAYTYRLKTEKETP